MDCVWIASKEICIDRNNSLNVNLEAVSQCSVRCDHYDSDEKCLQNQYCVWCSGPLDRCFDERSLNSQLRMLSYCDSKPANRSTIDVLVECPTGTYRNEKNFKCIPCRCNGHGNKSKGKCDPKTGLCYCEDNTEGSNCQRCHPGYYGDPKNRGNCFLGCSNRAVISNVSKTIAYFGSLRNNFDQFSQPKSSSGSMNPFRCLWILIADHFSVNDSLSSLPKPYSSIEVSIESMKINCSSSTLSIYDGLPKFLSSSNKQNNKILASFCGSFNITKRFFAHSGIATVLFLSDNHNAGFNGSYRTVQDHPREYRNRSSSLSNEKSKYFWPKESHSIEYYQNHLIFIGGHLDSKHLNLNIFSLRIYQWFEGNNFADFDPPENRYLHSSCLFNNRLYLYGGLIYHSNRISDDLWSAYIVPDNNSLNFFWINLRNSSLIRVKDSEKYFVWPPPSIGHSLTLINADDQEYLALIGGYSKSTGYLQNLFIYDLIVEQWFYIPTTGLKPIALVSHSSAFDPRTKLIYVFGGIEFKESHSISLSNRLYVLDWTSKFWYRIQPKIADSILPIFQHRIFILNNYLLVLNGRTSLRKSDRFSINQRLKPKYAFFLACRRWFSMEKLISNERIIANETEIDRKDSKSFSSVAFDGNLTVYSYEKSNSDSHEAKISAFKVPIDFCDLFSKNRQKCLATAGCSYCSINLYTDSNEYRSIGFCYDKQYRKRPDNCDPDTNPNNNQCLSSLSSIQRNCDEFQTCEDCTIINRHLDYIRCQWCSDCNHSNGRCIEMNQTCLPSNNHILMGGFSEREIQKISISVDDVCEKISYQKTESCPSRRCLATDCQKCLSLPSNINHNPSIDRKRIECIWTKQIHKFLRLGHSIATNPIFDWACIDSQTIELSALKSVLSMPPLNCPKRCQDYDTCQSCLEETTGDESGVHECVWSRLHQECMSPTFSMIRCHHEQCGGTINRKSSHLQCFSKCSQILRADDCLRTFECGWCSVQGLNPSDSVGFCTKGDLFGPSDHSCSNHSKDLRTIYKSQMAEESNFNLTTQWHYYTLPKGIC